MKQSPTLADAAIRESLRPHGKVPRELGVKIAHARRFVLDEQASSFLADLSHASYVNPTPDVINKKVLENIEQTRQLARIPHALTWIEYDPRAFRERTLTAYPNVSYQDADNSGSLGASPDQVIPNIGWLLEQKTETSFRLYTLVGANADGFCGVVPYGYAWTTDDSMPGVQRVTNPEGNSDSSLATGIPGYDVQQVTLFVVPGKKVHDDQLVGLIKEFIGELRFVWALLAAINDVPIGLKHVEQSKGYVARGRYRKFLDHTVISILIPKGRDPTKVARAVVSISRRRAHLVRGHWRRDWHHEGNRIWIKEHERGDASLGHVLHDYRVKHEEAQEAC
jgi:hypothetical protein